MIRLLILTFTLVLPSMVTAQATLVRTGLHDGFTRIVVDFPPGTAWSLDQADRIIRLRSDSRTGFDLDDVYRRIPRSRIDRIEQTAAGEISVTLACDCIGDATQLPNGHVMIDVQRAKAVPRVGSPVLGIRLPAKRTAAQLLPGRLTQAVMSEPPSDEARPSTASDRGEELRANLMDQMSRRMAEGLVEGRAPVAITENGSEPRPQELPSLPAGSNIAVSQGSDIADRIAPAIPPNVICPPFTRGTFADWPPPQNATPSDDQRLLTEALHLLADGLGAEARAVIGPRADDGAEFALLAEFARVMDAPVSAPLLQQAQECGPVAELFALIAGPPGDPSNPDLIMATIASAKPAVAGHLRTRAIEALRSLGRTEDARVLANAQTPGETRVRDLDIAILQAPLEPPSAETLLNVVRSRTIEAAEAMSRLLNGLLRDEGTVPFDIIDQATALARQTPPEDRLPLERAIIASLIAGDNYTAAASRIDAIAARVDQSLSDLDEMFFDSILSEPDPARFVRLAAQFFERLPQGSTQRHAVAERVFETGLPVLAAQILDHENGTPTRSERILRARIDLDARRPIDAEGHLEGLSGEDVDALRDQIAELPRPDRSPAPQEDPGIRERNAETIRRGSELRAELEALLSE